jgi:hypothetical protein
MRIDAVHNKFMILVAVSVGLPSCQVILRCFRFC